MSISTQVQGHDLLQSVLSDVALQLAPAMTQIRDALAIALNRQEDLRIHTPTESDVVNAMEEADRLTEFVDLQRSQWNRFRHQLFNHKWELEDMVMRVRTASSC